MNLRLWMGLNGYGDKPDFFFNRGNILAKKYELLDLDE